KEDAHGAALGEDEIALTREALGWRHGPFEIPEDIYSAWDARAEGARAEADWRARFEAYQAEHPELAAEFERRLAGRLPADFEQHADDFIARCQAKMEKVASR